MPHCPYPDHHHPVELELRLQRFAYCDECCRASFLCPAVGCGVLNRTLARYCRKCKNPLSLAEEERQWRENLQLDKDQLGHDPAERLDLSQVRARGLYVLCCYQ